MPREREYTKLRGLKKLKLLLRSQRGAHVAPYKVYDSPSAFRLEDMRGKPRLLVRMDEKGEEYRRISYAGIPREDISTEGKTSAEIQRQFEHMRQGVSGKDPLAKRPVEWSRFIVHPTGRRSEVYWTGTAELGRKTGHPRLTIRIGIGNPVSTNFFTSVVEIPFIWENSTFRLLRTPKPSPVFDYTKEGRMISAVVEIVQNGILSKQLRFFNQGYTKMAFNTWRDDPNYLEFYDLKEVRKMAPPAKQK